MKHYKSPNNEIYAYESDGSQDHIIPADYVAITDEEAEQLRIAMAQSQFNSLTYAQKRFAEYPPIFDYVDAIVKGDQAAVDKYIADCKAVKEKYPKP
jgi:hypothetical protein